MNESIERDSILHWIISINEQIERGMDFDCLNYPDDWDIAKWNKRFIIAYLRALGYWVKTESGITYDFHILWRKDKPWFAWLRRWKSPI